MADPKKKIIYIILGLSIFGIILTSPYVQTAKWMILSFLAPNLINNLEENWQNKPSWFLLRKLQSYDCLKAEIAGGILARRRNERALPILLDYANSFYSYRKSIAISNLGEFKDPRAIETLLKILKRGRKNRFYISALYSLAKMKYDPIYPNILEILNDKMDDRATAIKMLGYLGKPESLAILNEIYENDPKEYIREDAMHAIDKIKSQSKLGEKHGK